MNQSKKEAPIQCKTCYRIACRQCPWVATEEEVLAIQQGKLTTCPKCGWSPSPSK